MDNFFHISSFIPPEKDDIYYNANSGKSICESTCQCEPVCKKCDCDSMCSYNMGEMMDIVYGTSNPWINDYYNRK